MPTYTQVNRPMDVVTPLGEDVLLLVGLEGREAISQLFRFSLDLLAENGTNISFDQLLGGPIGIRLRLLSGQHRYLSGFCCSFSQGMRDEVFTRYRMEVVPGLWFLTRRAQSRIFQQKSVPDILKAVFADLDVSFELKGTYYPRDYCVQYRETDFHFASRLMEEEGIFYFFRHTAKDHVLVISDGPQSYTEIKEPALFEEARGGNRPEDRVYHWEKTQEVRSGKVTLWDHTFELPHDHLAADAVVPGSVTVGQVEHKLQVGHNDRLEIYDYPGEYAQRFDGVDPTGGDRPEDLKRITEDNKRTVNLRMEEQVSPAVVLRGSSTRSDFCSGYRYRLQHHFDADGPYVLTEVRHHGRLEGTYRNDAETVFIYDNTFTSIPAETRFRPARNTPKPVIEGTQTAVVVGPAGEEIFTDKYGRVKVQFHWDREGKNDEHSSCWIRVAQPVAGKRWGASFWPRIGQEVVVDYLEGDPDQPIIIGTVYNADQMPSYLGKGPDSKHPNDNKVSGIKSNTTKGGQGFNEWRFDDTQDKQQIFVHAERNMDVRVKKDSMELVQGNRHLIVGDEGGNQYEQITKDKQLHVKGNHVEKIDGAMTLTVGGSEDLLVKGQVTESFGSGHDLTVNADRRTKVGNSDSLTVGQNYQEKIGIKRAVDAGQEIHLKSGMTIVIEAGMQLTLKGPGGFVDIGPAGVTIQGIMVLINSGGAAGSGSGSSPDSPQDAKEAQPQDPAQADDATTGQKSCK